MGAPPHRAATLLAPAGSLAAVAAALSAGADAVYVGYRGWSRDGSRASLSAAEVPEAAAACASKGAELHVALNTVPGAAEESAFLAAVGRVREDGASAVILADPGVIPLVRREAPGMRITASVGLSTLNPAQARFYRELGADAVVLPTVLSPAEIPAIRAESGLRVEVFVHCRPEILLQGSCALPGYAGPGSQTAGRPEMAAAGTLSSAKRSGRCGLVCRAIPFSRTVHSLEGELPRWIAAGVDVFKVQGRELPPARLFDLVSRIRVRLDAALSGG